jgi:hypothetical protein
MPNKRLPPEVWHIIFRFAAGPLLPHALELRFLSPFDVLVDLETHWRMLGGRDLTRTSLALVCRSWNIMATPYIYEQIVIKTSEQERLLIRTLEHAKRDHLIKAIFIGFDLYIGRPSAEANITNSSIMRYMTRLKVYGIRCSHMDTHPVGCIGLKALSPPAACHPTSMILHVQRGILPTSLHEFLVSASTNLRILELSLPRHSSSDQAKHNRQLLLPNLHTLSIIEGGDAAALLDIARRWFAPSLQCICGLGHTASFPSTVFSSPEPSPVVPRVTSVTFNGPRVCNNFYEVFPDVEEIVFDVDVGRHPVMMMRPVPTCTRVGIIVHEVPEEERQMLTTAISDQFTPLSNPVMFPKLRLIRVMFVPARDEWIGPDSRLSATFFSDYKRRIFWTYWKKLWASRGVKLEATEPHTGIAVQEIPEVGKDSDELASSYERIWEQRYVDHSEDLPHDTGSENSWSDVSSLDEEADNSDIA